MDLSSGLAPPEAGEEEPPSAKRGKRASSIIPVAIIALVTWPVPQLAPALDIDGSWAAGLHTAAHFGIAHGRGIDFTYGPFGFLDVPRLYYPETALAAMLYTFAVHVALIAVIFFPTRRRAGVVVATAICLAVGTLALIEPAEVVPLVYFAGCLACLRFAPSERRIRLLVLLGTFLAAFQLLVKFNTGVVLFALAVALILALPKRKWAMFVLHGLGFFVCLTALWLSGGQPAGAFPTWLRSSAELAVGFTNAMAIEVRGSWEYWMVAATLVGVGLLVRASRPHMGLQTRYSVYGLLLLLIFAEWKHGFVRHDVHSVGFFFATVVIAISLVWFSSSAVRGLVVVTLLMIAAGFALPLATHDSLFRPAASLRQIKILASEHRREALITASKERVMRVYAIDPETLSLMAGHTVHVDPQQALLAWAYGFNWRPAPVFQAYSAYTPTLDHINARMLEAPDAPERILRVGGLAIDNRNRMFESPDYVLRLLCHYKEISSSKMYEVVARTGNRCGPERSLSRSIGGAGFVTVPRISSHELVVMRIQIKSPLVERINSLLYRPRFPPGIALRYVNGVQEFRLVEATAGDSLVLCVPRGAGFGPAFVQTLCPEAIRVIERETWSVSFSAVSIRS